MPWTAQDDYASAAHRHMTDAQLLYNIGRLDNAVHLAGFAAECAVKSSLEAAMSGWAGKTGSHRIDQMAGRDARWLAAVSPESDLFHAVASVQRGVLSHKHPDRRYWASGWPEDETKDAVAAAAQIVGRCVLDPILDRGRSFRED